MLFVVVIVAFRNRHKGIFWYQLLWILATSFVTKNIQGICERRKHLGLFLTEYCIICHLSSIWYSKQVMVELLDNWKGLIKNKMKLFWLIDYWACDRRDNCATIGLRRLQSWIRSIYNQSERNWCQTKTSVSNPSQ